MKPKTSASKCPAQTVIAMATSDDPPECSRRSCSQASGSDAGRSMDEDGKADEEMVARLEQERAAKLARAIMEAGDYGRREAWVLLVALNEKAGSQREGPRIMYRYRLREDTWDPLELHMHERLGSLEGVWAAGPDILLETRSHPGAPPGLHLVDPTNTGNPHALPGFASLTGLSAVAYGEGGFLVGVQEQRLPVEQVLDEGPSSSKSAGRAKMHFLMEWLRVGRMKGWRGFGDVMSELENQEEVTLERQDLLFWGDSLIGLLRQPAPGHVLAIKLAMEAGAPQGWLLDAPCKLSMHPALAVCERGLFSVADGLQVSYLNPPEPPGGYEGRPGFVYFSWRTLQVPEPDFSLRAPRSQRFVLRAVGVGCFILVLLRSFDFLAFDTVRVRWLQLRSPPPFPYDTVRPYRLLVIHPHKTSSTQRSPQVPSYNTPRYPVHPSSSSSTSRPPRPRYPRYSQGPRPPYPPSSAYDG